MGDRENGALNAGQAVFPEALPAACTRHISKNMQKQHLFAEKGSDKGLWLRVAGTATIEERDNWMQQIEQEYPKQAAFLSDIAASMWQNSEQLQLGYATHFTSTKNIAEGLGSKLLQHDYDQQCIGDMTAGPMIQAMLTLFSKQAATMCGHSAMLKRELIKYSDYALSILCVQKEQSLHHTSAQVGWLVRRKIIVTDKIRHVYLLD